MKDARGRIRLLAVLVLMACSDGSLVTEPTTTMPEPPSVFVTAVRGTVDVLAGTLTFEPLPAPGASLRTLRGISAAVYGDQGTTVQIYNSPVTITDPSSPGKKTYSADVGIRNLLAFQIGDEQAGPAPTDTMGIYAFINSGPTVVSTSSACSPACTVTAVNNHGTLPFTGLFEPYWHWPEVLGPAGTPTDTTLFRKTWVFEADAQVTAFSFDILINAAWAAPNETRWKIHFSADSVPDLNVEPQWRRVASGAAATIFLNTPSAGIITISVPAGASLTFLQADSLSSTTSAYIQARVRQNLATPGPEVSFGIDDEVKFIAVGLNGTQVGFITGNFSFLGTPVTTSSTQAFQVYLIRKFGADSAQLLMNGVRIASRTYAAFSASIAGEPYGFYFGGPGVGFPPVSPAGNASAWDHVIYEIGVDQP